MDHLEMLGHENKGNFVATLAPAEKDHGLKCVALSRATKFSDTHLIDGITVARSWEKIKRQK